MNSFSHEVFTYDVKEQSPEPYIKFSSTPWSGVDVTFICVPEWAVYEAVRLLVHVKAVGLLVIKSTVSLGTTDELMKQFGVHICHNPEFLREKHSQDDVVTPDRVIVGRCCEEHGALLSELYAPLKKPTFVTTPMASELAKLVSNAYLATLITFWNEVNEITQRLKLDVEEASHLVCSDSRMSRYGIEKFGEPFGGKCLPKDLNHLIEAFKSNGLNPTLFEAVERFNEKLGLKMKA